MKTTFVVCESPGSTKGRLERWSVRPFVEGLCELYDATLVYLACHGRGGRLELGRRFINRPNLGILAKYLRSGVEGVWLGACDLGGSIALERFCEGQGGAIWAGGYVCAVDWETSLASVAPLS